MIFKESRKLKSFISKLLFGVYFIALFSQNFHYHDSLNYFKGFDLKKIENTITKNIVKEKSSDCLACYFLVTVNSLVPEEFSFSFESFIDEVKRTILIQEKIWSQAKFTFQLRGPPGIYLLTFFGFFA